MSSEDFIKYALLYLKLGFSPIPTGKNKIPTIKWEEFQQRKATAEEIHEWANKFPDSNIGIVTGAISDIVVVDVEAGGDTKNLPPTVVSKTGGGGYHFYYKHPNKPVKNAVRIREKTDIRADGGYVVAPYSIHSSGNSYEWIVSPEDADFAELPQWVLDEAGESKTKTDWKEFLSKEQSNGTRNMTAAQLAGKLLYHLPPELWEISGWSTLKEWNTTNNNPPLSEAELRTVWESINKSEIQKRNFKPIPETRTPIDFATLEETIHKWLLINDKGLIRVLVGTVVANKLKADPVWLFIIAAPGGSKTELIRGLNKVDKVYSISDLTPQTFLSGEKNNKTGSLLLRLPFGTIFTYKDFTTVLTMHRDKQQAIISQLREIFDGYYRKEFGTGETKDWVGKIGFIAGVTTVIDRHHEIYSVLGERFVQYRPIQPDRIALAKKAISNSGGEDLMREEIQKAMADYISGIKIPEEKVAIPDWLVDKVAHLASFVVKARSGIIRESYHTREIEQIPDPELPTRLAKQLITLATAFSLMNNGQFTEDDYSLIYKIGLDSLPAKRKLTIEALLKQEDYLETSEFAIAIGYPTNTTRRILEDLQGLQLIDKQPKWKGTSDGWKIKNSTIEDLKKAGWVPEESNTVPEMSEEPTPAVKQEELL